MRRFINRGIEKFDPHTLDILSKGTRAMAVRILGIGSRFLISIFLGRELGAEGLGNVNIVNQSFLIVMMISMLGTENALIKEVSIGVSIKDNKSIRNNVFTAFITNGIAAIIFGSLGIIFAEIVANKVFHSAGLSVPLMLMFGALLPETLGRVFSAAINGVGKIWQSNFFQEVLTNLSVVVGMFVFWLGNVEFTIINIIFLYAGARVLKLVFAFFFWKQTFKVRGKLMYQAKLIRLSMPLLVVSSLAMISSATDILMLGWLSDSRETGLYSVGSRLAILLTFFSQVSNSVISPKIAALYANSKIIELELMVKRVTAVLFVIGFLFLLFFIFFGRWTLGLWGDEFKETYPILIILGIGQLINISTGCSGLLLIMCGFEKSHSFLSGIFVTANIVLNFILIGNYGALGAAIATSFTIIVQNIVSMYLAKKHTGILTLPKLV